MIKVILMLVLLCGCTENQRQRMCEADKKDMEKRDNEIISQLNAESESWHESFLTCSKMLKICNCKPAEKIE